MSPRIWIFLGALSAATGVGLGAYHAHGLEKTLLARGLSSEELQRQLNAFEVGVRYQMIHALALILISLLGGHLPAQTLNIAGSLFVAGTLLFSGCLYIPVLAAVKLPWFLVPSGGVAFICGWAVLAICALISAK